MEPFPSASVTFSNWQLVRVSDDTASETKMRGSVRKQVEDCSEGMTLTDSMIAWPSTALRRGDASVRSAKVRVLSVKEPSVFVSV